MFGCSPTITEEMMKTLYGFGGDIKISYSPDGSILEIFTDAVVHTFDTATAKIVSNQKYTDTDALLLQELPSSQGYIGRVDGLVYSPDGQTLAVSNHTSSPVLLWDIPTKQIKATIETAASRLVYSHRGELLASVDQYPSVYENPPTDENLSEDENAAISIRDTGYR
jgi:WD40 repeat protein